MTEIEKIEVRGTEDDWDDMTKFMKEFYHKRLSIPSLDEVRDHMNSIPRYSIKSWLSQKKFYFGWD